MLKLLDGVRVLELSLFAPDALGGHLADLGADVIKLEQPGGGGMRGDLFPQPMLENLQWNRGKRSVALDLHREEGRALGLELASQSQVFIDGLRAGAASRLGLSYEDVVEANPRVVYCSLNGMGSDGPYATLPTHGLSFDCLAGLTPPAFDDQGRPCLPGGSEGLVGVTAGPLYAAMAVLAALHRAVADQAAQRIEVAQVDAAVVWNSMQLVPAKNGRSASMDRISGSVRYQYYETSDGKYVVFMALEDKFWRRFCEAVDRPDLYEMGCAVGRGDAELDDIVRAELTKLFVSRTRSHWTQFFLDHDVAGAPANEPAEVLDDPHVRTRGLVYDTESSEDGFRYLIGSPVMVERGSDLREPFGPAPAVGEHTQEVLTEVLGLTGDHLRRLRAEGVA